MVEKNLFQFCGNTKRYIIEAVLINCIRLVANITFSFMFASVLAHFITGVYVFNPKISYMSAKYLQMPMSFASGQLPGRTTWLYMR